MKSECLFIVCLVMLLAACTPTRQAVTTSIQRDTVYMLEHDTLYVYGVEYAGERYLSDGLPFDFPFVDSSYFEWEKASTLVVIEKDTVWRMRVKTKVKTDTVYIEKKVPVITIKEKIIEIPGASEPGKFPWLLVVSTLGALGLWWNEKQKQSKKT